MIWVICQAFYRSLIIPRAIILACWLKISTYSIFIFLFVFQKKKKKKSFTFQLQIVWEAIYMDCQTPFSEKNENKFKYPQFVLC